MKFTLRGFTQRDGFRRFAFECVADSPPRATIIVGADVGLARKHDIRLQELPLICLRLLESLEEGRVAGPLAVTEDQMIAIQTEARSAAEKGSHKAPRRPSPLAGQAWRGAPK